MKASSLQLKMLFLVSGALTVSLGASLFALTQVHASVRELDRIAQEISHSQTATTSAALAFADQIHKWKNVLLRGADAKDLDKYWSQFLQHEKEADSVVKRAQADIRQPRVAAKLDEFLASHAEAGERYRKGLSVFKDSKFDAHAADQAVVGVDRVPGQLLRDALQLALEEGGRSREQTVRQAERSYGLAIAGTVLAILVALGAMWLFMRRAVLKPINAAVAHAQRITQGDLTADIQSTSRDEAGQLLAALGRMNAGLAEVVTQVRASAESVVTASGQLAIGTSDLSQRTEEQASSLEETAASMEELSSTVKQNADNAQKADALARTASRRAEQGGAEVVQVVVTMNEISRSAAKIVDIISVIDGIAFQTNILALNAAVEAARAGEQGRGFAVVASEVRSLAQRSAQAAKEIKGLIGDSVARAKDGTSLVEKAGETIQGLVIDVKQVSELMGSIAEASAEQSRGVQQVNKTVTEMDKVVQQNAAAVQESASAAAAMRRQAQALLKSVSTFHLKAEPGAQRTSGEHVIPTPETPAKTLAPALIKRPALAMGPNDDWEEF